MEIRLRFQHVIIVLQPSNVLSYMTMTLLLALFVSTMYKLIMLFIMLISSFKTSLTRKRLLRIYQTTVYNTKHVW